MDASTLRISDAEREPSIERLKTAFAEGRLDRDEFELRVQLAMTARTAADLSPLTADLDRRTAPPAPAAAWPQPPSTEDRLLAALAHGSAWLPIIVIPALIMATAGDRSDYVRRHAAEAVNFQLTLLAITLVTFGIGGILYAVAWAIGSVAAVLALIGQDVRYPWILRLVRGRR